jgi:hypothetical protein
LQDLVHSRDVLTESHVSEDHLLSHPGPLCALSAEDQVDSERRIGYLGACNGFLELAIIKNGEGSSMEVLSTHSPREGDIKTSSRIVAHEVVMTTNLLAQGQR